ncbi:MAG: endonuclease [Paludibacteraceae bacterium]|nr:endonuclease [Paludibacteraceae bacterium]
MKHRHHIFSLVFAVVLLLPLPVRAITSSYYSSINGKKETALRDALYTITSAGPSGMSYDGLWTAYQTTDVYPSDSTGKAGKIWDMYSDCLFTPTGKGTGKQCGTYSGVCDCFNREHSLPKSWFNEKKPAYYDLGHIVPTDGKVNGMRSNNVFGECASGYATWGTGKLGNAKAVTTMNVKGSSTITTTFTGTAFEPADKYKGDFARMYMYMVIRYKPGNSNSVDLAAAGEGSTMFNSTDTNYGLTDYSIALLMKWHRQDPVSQKEIDRNNGMETTQRNRNPFIDYPCLAEYLWGNKAGQAVTLSELVGTFTGSWTSGDGCPCVGPTITSPTGTVNIGTTNTSNSIYKDVTVQGTNLENSSLTLTIGGTHGSYFKLPGGASSTTITKAQAEAGYNITITYTPTANGSHSATLTISGCGVTSHVVTLTGTCTTVYTATWMADGSTFGTSTAASGASPELPAPNPSNCTSSRVFVGWTDNENYSGSGSDLFTDEAPTMTTDKTFFAVYADKSTGAGGGSPVVTTVFSTTSLGSTNTVTTGYTVSATASAKSGYYQDGSGTSGVTIYNTTTPMFTSTPSAISLTVSIGAGSGNLDFSDYVYATLVNGSGTAIGTAVQITNHVTTSTGDSYIVSIPTTGITSANGIYLYHTKESGKNIRYYSASLSITTGGSTTTYDNYSTQCTASSCTLSNITLNTSIVQKSFAVGDAFNYTGLIVTANYSDCISKTVTPTSVSSPDMSTTGDKTVTVSYTESGTTKTATYTITVEAAPEYTVTFMNMGGTHATCTGTAGSAISAVSDPTACSGYTFEGWSTSQYAVDNIGTPSLSTPTTIPAGNVTYYAVYSKTEGSGSSSTSNITASASLVSGSTSGYTFATGKNGGSSDPSYNSTGSDVRLYAKNQITISASSTITQIVFNLSTQGKKRLASIEASAGTIATQNSGDNKVTWTGSATSVTFTVGDKATYGGDGASKAGQLCFTSVDITSGSGSSTTYHTTAPDCSCTATITATSNDDSMGTVSVTTP